MEYYQVVYLTENTLFWIFGNTLVSSTNNNYIRYHKIYLKMYPQIIYLTNSHITFNKDGG